jgi:EAL domain-containing protein (putative c-di-GMP-specific phosphodiesterase class I)/CheY-like chemotaxis protein
MNTNEFSVMVVEDHGFQRRMMLQLLGQLGVGRIWQAENGREALNLLMTRDEPVDLILCDLDMPEMDGVEFISHVAVNKLARSLVVVSGVDLAIIHTVETMARAYGIQVLGMIPKPVTAHQLQECLDRATPADAAGDEVAAPDEVTVEQLRYALAKREFLPFFQPKVSLATGEIKGVETLVRWYRPGRGVFVPKDFIHRLEEEGLMDDLTELLLRQTCTYLRAWAARGLDLSASVNISMRSLEDISIADRLHALVLEEDCDPRRITLEVTETDVMSRLAVVLNGLARLRLKGFNLSIDDFGTGYSSLQQLNTMPFTELKVDQSFVMNSPADERCRTIIESSLDLARKLNLKSVAEGVETRAEWDLVKALGCEEAQGYFISRPMPGHQLPDWAELWQPPIAPEPARFEGSGTGYSRKHALALEPRCALPALAPGWSRA